MYLVLQIVHFLSRDHSENYIIIISSESFTLSLSQKILPVSISTKSTTTLNVILLHRLKNKTNRTEINETMTYYTSNNIKRVIEQVVRI